MLVFVSVPVGAFCWRLFQSSRRALSLLILDGDLCFFALFDMVATSLKAVCFDLVDVVFGFDLMAGVCPDHLISSLNSPFLQFNVHE